jgi:NOL1/NOP2/fmu family ribosome biogenesis protein
MRIQFLSPGEKKKLFADVEEQFGIQKVPGILLQAGREKIRLFTGSLTREQIQELSHIVRIEIVGLYAFKFEQDYRLSFDSLFLFENQITKSVVELDDAEMRQWMKGNDLQKSVRNGVIVLKYKDLFLGCGKSNGTVIFNYVPKNRRVLR